MFGAKTYLLWHWCFHPFRQLNTGSMFVFPEQHQQEHVQGAINIPLKEVKDAHCHRRSG